ncbi:MAG: hypothetical protein R3F19_06205 [Verrucomicrobiales bacterium]
MRNSRIPATTVADAATFRCGEIGAWRTAEGSLVDEVEWEVLGLGYAGLNEDAHEAVGDAWDWKNW